MDQKKLLENQHPQTDIFIFDIADAAMKANIASIGHPLFVLAKNPCMKRRRYQHGDTCLEIIPSAKGIANIWDKDILIFAISQIVTAKNAGRPYERHVSFTAHDFLAFRHRNTGGKDYASLKDSLERLNGTQFITHVMAGDAEQVHDVRLVDTFMSRRIQPNGYVVEWEITLSDWLFAAIDTNEVLTLSNDYFRLKKPLERCLYEMACKYCGNKKEWRIDLALLLKKCGSSSPKRNFKSMLKQISKDDHLPDYQLEVIDDMVVFTSVATDMKKRHLFDELMGGVDALKQEREGKLKTF